MEDGHPVEDRVFGLPELYPEPPLPLGPSTSYDLMSVAVEGAEVVYAAQGTTAHPPLVFLHGWGASHKFWRHALAAFSPRYRCLAPDLVGFGLSEKPERDYSVPALAAWLERFLDAAGIPRATIVGHSMGGSIALLFAIEHPARVERLVVSNPLLQGSSAFTRRTRCLTFPGVRRLVWGLAHVRWIRRWVTRDFSFVQKLDPELAQDVVSTTYACAIGSLRSCLEVDLVPRLGELKVPTLAIGTDMDSIIINRQFELIPAAEKVCLPQTGHIPMVERPQEFNRAVDRFLRKP